MNRFILAVGLALGGLLVAAPVVVAQHEPSAGNAVEGKRIFLADGCYECHGTAGAGGGYSGPSLAPNPLPLAAVKAQLRHPASRMPAYAESVISDAQIADIVAYLESIPAGKSASQIPLLNQ